MPFFGTEQKKKSVPAAENVENRRDCPSRRRRPPGIAPIAFTHHFFPFSVQKPPPHSSLVSSPTPLEYVDAHSGEPVVRQRRGRKIYSFSSSSSSWKEGGERKRGGGGAWWRPR